MYTSPCASTDIIACHNYFDDKTGSSLSFLTWMNNLLTLFNLNPTNSFTPHQKPESFFSIVRFILIGSRSCTGPKYLLPQVERPMNQKKSTEVVFQGASLVAQWLRIRLPMQGTRVQALVWEDPTCRGATRPVSHNYWACASGACAPQQERPR